MEYAIIFYFKGLCHHYGFVSKIVHRLIDNCYDYLLVNQNSLVGQYVFGYD